MNTARDILSYAQSHDIRLSIDGDKLKVNAPKEVLTDEFLATTKQHKAEILKTLSKPERWDPELVADGYVWCQDCLFYNGFNCGSNENPFKTVEKQPAVARKCQWYEERQVDV